MKVILSLDLSIKSSGYSVMSFSGDILEKGLILPEKYRNYTRDKYPKKTIKFIQSIVQQIQDLVEKLSETHEIDYIVIEEINPGKGGLVSTKSLSYLHGILLDRLIDIEYKIKFVKTSEWRSKLKISAKGFAKVKDAIKIVTIDWANKNYGLSLEMTTKGDHDIADAIAIAEAFRKINKLDK